MPLKVEVKVLSLCHVEHLVNAPFHKFWAVENGVFATEFIHLIKYTFLGELRQTIIGERKSDVTAPPPHAAVATRGLFTKSADPYIVSALRDRCHSSACSKRSNSLFLYRGRFLASLLPPRA